MRTGCAARPPIAAPSRPPVIAPITAPPTLRPMTAPMTAPPAAPIAAERPTAEPRGRGAGVAVWLAACVALSCVGSTVASSVPSPTTVSRAATRVVPAPLAEAAGRPADATRAGARGMDGAACFAAAAFDFVARGADSRSFAADSRAGVSVRAASEVRRARASLACGPFGAAAR